MEKEEQAKQEQEQLAGLGTLPEADQWGDVGPTGDWKTEGTGIGVSTTQQTPAITTAFAAAGSAGGGEDWNVGPTSTKDWAADDAGDWGNAEPEVSPCWMFPCPRCVDGWFLPPVGHHWELVETS